MRFFNVLSRGSTPIFLLETWLELSNIDCWLEICILKISFFLKVHFKKMSVKSKGNCLLDSFALLTRTVKFTDNSSKGEWDFAFNNCPIYKNKLRGVDVSALDIWKEWGTFLVPLHSGPLWLGVLIPFRFPSIVFKYIKRVHSSIWP